MAKPKKKKKQSRVIKKNFTEYKGPSYDPYKELSMPSDQISSKPIEAPYDFHANAPEGTYWNEVTKKYEHDFTKSPQSGEITPDNTLASFAMPVGKTAQLVGKGVKAVKNYRNVSKVKKIVKQRQDQLRTKEGFNRLTQQELSRNPKLTVDQARVVAKKQIDKLSDTKIIVDPKKKDAYLPQSNTLVLKQADNAPVLSHELTHAIDAGLLKPKVKAFSTIKDYAANASIQNRIRSGFTFKDNLTEKASRSLNYFKTGSKGREATAFLSESRQHLLNKKFLTLGKDGYFNKVTPKMLKKAFNNLKKNPSKDSFKEGTRIFDFIKDTPKNFKHLAKEMNSLPVVAPIVEGAISSQVKPIKRKKQ